MSITNHPRSSKVQRSAARLRRDGGYMLLAIMLVMAVMIIAATAAAPVVVQQMKRDREEEMIHRGTQYARAIKAFYKKNGRYPASLDDLDKGQIKFLRQRYKDPLSKDGKWKLLNYGDIATLLNGAAPGTPAAAMGTLGGGNTTSPGSVFSNSSSPTGFPGGAFQPQQQQQQFQQQSQQLGGATSGFPTNSDMGGNGESVPGGTFAGSSTGSDQGFGSSSSNQSTGSNQPGGLNGNQSGGTTFGANSAGNGQTFGGGAIVGVASLSKDPTIRIYNKKKTYNEWQFIYNPMMDQTNVLLQGPYQPITIGGNQNIGMPASQMNGQQQNQSPFGQQNNNSFGSQNNSFGQQNNGGSSQPTPMPSSSPQ
jgi:type II secretory pathway pseudopilin PulG